MIGEAYADIPLPVMPYLPNALNQYTAVGSDSLAYDLNGNLISDGGFPHTVATVRTA